jgi:hypothetical protein
MPSGGKLSNRLIQPGLTAVVGGGGAAPVESGLTASGGTIGTYTANNATYRYHVFDSSGTFTVSAVGQTYNDVEVLIAGGGQGAGPASADMDTAGGAGAAVRYYGSEPKANTGMTATGAALTNVTVGNYTVTVGGGGAATGASGTASSFVGGSYNLSSPSGFTTTAGNSSAKSSNNNANFKGGHGTDPNIGPGGAGCAAHGSGVNFRTSDGTAAAHPGNGGIHINLTGVSLGFGGGGAGGKTGYGAGNTDLRANGGTGAGDAGEASRANSGAGGSGRWNNVGPFAGASGTVIIRYRIY